MSTIDVKVLAQHNAVVSKWANIFKVESSRLSKMVHQVVTRDAQLLGQLTLTQKAELHDDMESFSYVHENANGFVEQNRRLIFVVANELGIRDVDHEHESMGLLALMRAYYTYDNSVSLAHYCCVLIKRDFFRINRNRKLEKNKIWQTSVHVDYGSADAVASAAYTPEHNEVETPEEAFQSVLQNESKLDNFLQRISQTAKLNNHDKVLLKILFNRQDKSNQWVQEFFEKTGLTITKQAVYLRKDNLMRTVRKQVQEQGMKLFN